MGLIMGTERGWDFEIKKEHKKDSRGPGGGGGGAALNWLRQLRPGIKF